MNDINWRYYKCKLPNGISRYVIQHKKYTALHIESSTKKGVLNKLNTFLTKEIGGNIEGIQLK